MGGSAAEVEHRSNLDGALADSRDAPSDRKRFVEVLDVDQVISTELLASLGVRSVGDQRPAIVEVYGGCGGRRGQSPTAAILAGLAEVLFEALMLAHDRRHLGLALRGPIRLISIDHQHVNHPASSWVQSLVERRSRESTAPAGLCAS